MNLFSTPFQYVWIEGDCYVSKEALRGKHTTLGKKARGKHPNSKTKEQPLAEHSNSKK